MRKWWLGMLVGMGPGGGEAERYPGLSSGSCGEPVPVKGGANGPSDVPEKVLSRPRLSASARMKGQGSGSSETQAASGQPWKEKEDQVKESLTSWDKKGMICAKIVLSLFAISVCKRKETA